MIRSVTTFQGEEVVCPSCGASIEVESRGEELQAENAALIGIVEKATAAVQRIQELRDEWAKRIFPNDVGPYWGEVVEELDRALDDA